MEANDEMHPVPSSGECISIGGRYGTLGGFVGSSADIYFLLSGHLAVPTTTSVSLRGDPRELGQIFACLRFMDIAIAVVNDDIKPTCDMRLKDRKGCSLQIPCEVESDENELAALPVYIFGARSKPGKGIIATPFFNARSGGRQHMLIENLSSEEKDFCEPGDSGALVLGENPRGKKVFAIAIVVGEYTDKENPACTRKQYLAAGLKDGLQDLSQGELDLFKLLY